jgi:hypothetical protein
MPKRKLDIEALGTLWLKADGKIEIEFSEAFFKFDLKRQVELAVRVANVATTEIGQIANDAMEALDASEAPEDAALEQA